MSFIERAALIIENIKYITVASVCHDGTPWNSPVYTAYDKKLNFYWKSWVENEHSKNIVNCPDVFLVIYDSRVACGEGEGVYIKARARPLEKSDECEVKKGYDLLKMRVGHASSKYEDFLDGDPRLIYKATPSAVWINDGSTKNGDFIDIRQGLNLEDLKEKIEQNIADAE